LQAQARIGALTARQGIGTPAWNPFNPSHDEERPLLASRIEWLRALRTE
jgi:hypothetical protein